MHLSRTLLGAVCLGAGLLVVTIRPESVRAQKAGKADDKRLPAEPFRGADKAVFDQLRDGKIDYANPHKAILEKAARSYVYRLTHQEVQELSTKSSGMGTISEIVNTCCSMIPDVRRPAAGDSARTDRQRRFVQEFGRALVSACEDVLKTREPIARINAARILARLGDTGFEEFVDPLTRVVEDKEQLDAVKLYALRGLKESFVSVEKFKDPEREARAIQAIIAFLHRPAPETSSGEEMRAFHYVRREAVAALAKCRQPAVELNKKVVSQPALELLRVVTREGFEPRTAPILSERVEAAVGVGLMQTKRYEKFYNPDYAAQHTGYFLIEFVNKYHADRQKQQPIPDEPWKIHAARLRQAVLSMRDENSKNKYIVEVVRRAESVLEQVEQSKAVSIQPFRNWLEANPPPSKSLYKNDDKATVKLPAPTEA